MKPQAILVSACLLGLPTRYDGRTKHNQRALDYLRQCGMIPVPVCPEQLAGLATPRPMTFFACGDGTDVLDGSGNLISENRIEMSQLFIQGATRTLEIARLAGCQQALFKDGSPSCGVHRICRNGARVAGKGVTSALLKRSGLRVFSEEDL
jgi:uncharacterized protein YbbK (DUF523 family)